MIHTCRASLSNHTLTHAFSFLLSMPRAKANPSRPAEVKAASKPPTSAVSKVISKASKIADKSGAAKAISTTLPDHLQTLLDDLVPSWQSQYKPERLQLIRTQTQVWWREFTREHLKNPVRFLVIAEAPPWRRNGDPTYVYKPNDGDYEGGILGALVGGISAANGDSSAPVFAKKNADAKAATLRYLGEQGVLLVDPLPFSLFYSGKGDGCKHSNLRDKAAYTTAARVGWEEVLAQLDDAGVVLHDKVVIGFTLLKSARALTIDSGQALRPLRLPGGREVVIEPKDATFTTSAGYPDAKVLARMLNEHTPLPKR